MFGSFNRILNVDLQHQTWSVEGLAEDIYRKYLSGKGLGSYLLVKLNPPGVDPLSPDNHLILSPGFASGTRQWGASRYGIFTKSPLTGIYTESYSGGFAAMGMTRAGYDAIVLKKADHFLMINRPEEFNQALEKAILMLSGQK